jgi:hypothetical protein
MWWAGHAGRIREMANKNITKPEGKRPPGWLQSVRDEMIQRISAHPYPPQKALTDSHICALRLETALAAKHVLARHVDGCMSYIRAFFHYHNVPGCICTLWRLELKRESDKRATLFSQSLGLLSHTQAVQGSLNRCQTAGVNGRIIIKWFLKKTGLKIHLTRFLWTWQCMNKWVPWKSGTFLTTLTTLCFSWRLSSS